MAARSFNWHLNSGAGFFLLEDKLEEMRENIPQFNEHDILPFGDDYGGSLFCFQMDKADKNDECPVVLWDRAYSRREGPIPEAASFTAFVADGLEAAE